MIEPATFTRESWVHTWLRTAGLGMVLLTVYFVAYEVIERAYLLERFSTLALFRFHIYRGVGAAILLSTWSFVRIWRTRRRYDSAFDKAYRELKDAHEARTEALARSKAFSDRLFDALQDRLVVVSPDGRVVKANRVALEAMGPLSLNRPCSMLGDACVPGGSGCVALRALKEGRPIVGQVIRTDPRTGRVFEVDAYPIPDPESGQEVVVEVARDITEARQMEARLRSQEKLAALGVLSAGIAHDIANPLASMSSELELLESERDLGKLRESLPVLRRQVARINRTLREMTEFARRRGDERSTLSVGEAVEDALRMVRHDPRARRISIETQLAPELPELRMVEDHLVMVLVNLTLNAFDAMPKGGRLVIRAEPDEGGVRLWLTDSGEGMSPEVQRRALDPLFTTKSKGTGLGLTVSADLVRTVGGSLRLESSVGEGTTVELFFPHTATLKKVANA
ncbi:MAG: PAS domain-containing protein [Myxococcales bacterium]|nr:PAS domain-containing protein [Myxococcales bacterium]